MMYENRNYLIFNVSELDVIDFSQVLETSVDTVRRSVDGTKTFVKWDCVETPPSVSLITSATGPYAHNDFVKILKGSEWSGNPHDVIY